MEQGASPPSGKPNSLQASSAAAIWCLYNLALTGRLAPFFSWDINIVTSFFFSPVFERRDTFRKPFAYDADRGQNADEFFVLFAEFVLREQSLFPCLQYSHLLVFFI